MLHNTTKIWWIAILQFTPIHTHTHTKTFSLSQMCDECAAKMCGTKQKFTQYTFSFFLAVFFYDIYSVSAPAASLMRQVWRIDKTQATGD